MRGTGALLLAFLIPLSGCGGSSSPATTNPPSAPSYATLTGNWALVANSTVVVQTTQIGAYITNTNGSVSGTIHPLNSPCFSLAENVPISGNVTTSGAVSATSSAIGSQVLTLTGNVSAGLLSGGTYSIAGGCGAGDKGTVTGYIVPAFSNTYSGTFLSVSEVSISTTLTTAQIGPDSNGFYGVSGSATFSGSPCFTSAMITNSTITGAYMEVVLADSDGSTTTFGGYITDSSGKTIAGDYQVSGGKCSGDHGTGSVSHS
jgi:hypothetical protein